MLMPIVSGQPPRTAFICAEKSSLTSRNPTCAWLKDEGLGDPGPRRSTFAVLPASDSRSRIRNGSPRGSIPPELPAGKRGGWHHDSVYPNFRHPSLAPPALSFAPECDSLLRQLDSS